MVGPVADEITDRRCAPRAGTNVRTRIGVILAGGRGRRMGGAKGDALLDGTAMLEHVARAMDGAGLDVVVVTKSVGAPKTGRRLLIEPDEPVHPLAGIHHALAQLDERVVVCPCDMPLVPTGLLAHLARADGPSALVTGLGSYLQPLVGRYGPPVRERMGRAIRDEVSARRFIESLGPDGAVVGRAVLERFGDPSVFMRDVDTRDDLAWAASVIDPVGSAPVSREVSGTRRDTSRSNAPEDPHTRQ